MKMNLDDPNLTAYALGELSGPARADMEKAVAQSAEAQALVQETRQIGTLLESDFAAELNRAAHKPLNIMPLPAERSFWSDARWMSIGLAALLAVCAVIAAVALSPRGNRVTSIAATPVAVGLSAKPNDSVVQMEVEAASPGARIVQGMDITASRDPNTAGINGGFEFRSSGATSHFGYANGPASQEDFSTADYGHFEENPFLPAATNPLSTFSIDVDTASYSNVRRMLNAGTKPPKDSVRIEEMINYFTYDYPQPDGKQPFSINLEVAGCPWTPEHRLVRIGLKGREIASDKRGASNLVFLLDVSGSMEPTNRLPLVKQAMRLLVERLTENDRVAIVVYAGGSGLVLPSTTGDRKEEILRALENLQAGGSTNGAAGITGSGLPRRRHRRCRAAAGWTRS